MIGLRQVTAIPTLMMWRAEVIRHVFGIEPAKRLLVENRRYYRTHIPDGTHLAFVADIDGEPCGCGGVCFSDELPSPDNPTGRCAYLMNIYVREPYRHSGAASSARHETGGAARFISNPLPRGTGFMILSDSPICPT